MLVYYVPEARAAGLDSIRDALARLELAGLLGDPPADPEALPLAGGGPDGGAGRLLWWPPARTRLEGPHEWYRPRLHRDWLWREAPRGADRQPRYWLGWDPLRPYRPEQLARPHAVPGIDVQMADGNKWCFPVARVLPRVFGLSSGGEWTSQVRPEYAAWVEQAEAMYPRLQRVLESLIEKTQGQTGPAQAETTIAQGMDWIAASLAINYRVTRETVGLLGLVDDYCALDACGAPFELPVLQELARQKKTDRRTLVGSAT